MGRTVSLAQDTRAGTWGGRGLATAGSRSKGGIDSEGRSSPGGPEDGVRGKGSAPRGMWGDGASAAA